MASFHHRVKSGKKGRAKEHAAYIERSGRNRDRDDLVYTKQGNLPAWAENRHQAVWSAADKYERSNGAAYREHVVALPNELTIAQNIVLAEKITDALVGEKAYLLAVHSSEGSLSGVDNPHMHVMLSDRSPDGINRSAQQTYARYNATHPERGGCRKDSGGRTRMELRDELIGKRKRIADIINQALEEAGSHARVDSRSLQERGLERSPERTLGPARVKGMTDGEKASYAALWRTPSRHCAAEIRHAL